MVSAVNPASDNPFATLGLTTQATQTKRNELGMKDFFKLMTVQLQNQDPMKPLENSEFLGQVAQFTTVSGINQLNETFTELADSLASSQALQAGTLVGREVLVTSNVAALGSDGAVRGVARLDAGAADVVLHVRNAAGQLVRDVHLGAQRAGDVHFSWDGLNAVGARVPPGPYYITAEALAGDRGYALQTDLIARIDAVNLGGAHGITLDLAGLGTVPFDSIREIR
jgi:flagellar basal-body rod modification protein FlgD